MLDELFYEGMDISYSPHYFTIKVAQGRLANLYRNRKFHIPHTSTSRYCMGFSTKINKTCDSAYFMS